jgi:hypothetical protein
MMPSAVIVVSVGADHVSVSALYVPGKLRVNVNSGISGPHHADP